MNRKEWKEVREKLTEGKIREMYEAQDKIMCAYCGHTNKKSDKAGVINHTLTCDKRPEKKLLAEAWPGLQHLIY